MARLFNDATPDWMSNTSGLYTGNYPVTFCCWFRHDDAAQVSVPFSLAQSTTTTMYHALRLRGDLAGDPVEYVAATTALGATVARTTNGTTINTWHCVVGVALSLTDRRVYLDGDIANSGVDTASRSPTTTTMMVIGRRGGSSGSEPFSGAIEHCTYWQGIALTENEVIALANGRHPRTVRPRQVTGYWPVAGNSAIEPDWTSGRNGMVITGSPTKAATNAPVTPYTKRFWSLGEIAAVTAVTYEQSLSGAIAPISTMSTLTFKTFSGAITALSSITVSELGGIIELTLNSAISMTSSVSVLTHKVLTGTIAPTSALSKLTLKTFSSVITATSAVSKRALKSLSGALTPISTIAKLCLRTFSNAITPISSTSKLVLKTLSGTITSVSSVLATKTGTIFTVILNNSLNMASSLATLFIEGVGAGAFNSMYQWYRRRRRGGT